MSYLDNEFLEVARKKSFKNFYFGDLNSGQIWLIALVYDDDSQSTYFTILGKKNKDTRDDDDVDTESHKISSP